MARFSPRRRRRLAATITVGAVVLAAAAYVGVTLGAPLPAPVVSLQAPQPAPSSVGAPAFPDGVPAAAGVVGYPDPIVGPGGDAPRPIASITKIVTALVVLDKLPLQPGEDGPTFTLDDTDVQNLRDVLSVGGSSADVEPGEQLTELQLLQGMLVPSADNFALTLAQRAYGDVPSYVSAARTWLDAHGFPDVTIDSPTGLEDTDAASAADLVRLGFLALQNPVIAATVQLQSVTLPVAGRQISTNQLLGQPGVVGIKTGHTEAAGYCLLLAETIDVDGSAQTVVTAVQNTDTITERFTASQPIVDSMPATFASVDLVDSGAAIGEATTAWGASTPLVAASSASVLTWNGIAPTASAGPGALPDDAAAGTTAGTLAFDYNGQTQSVAAVTASALAPPDAWWRLTHPAALFGGG